MIIEGYIEFENAIPVIAECLGKEYPIVISGVNGILATPKLCESFKEEFSSNLKCPEPGNIKYNDEFIWGSVNSWPSGDSAIRSCKIVFQDISEHLIEKTSTKIVLGLKKWRLNLIDNISLALQRDYRGTTRSKVSKSYGLGEFGLFINHERSNKPIVPNDPEIITVRMEKGLFFDSDDLQKTLLKTSQGFTPLLPFYFLFDAERAEFDDNYRKSILDSATSVEVCFSYLIGQLLPFDKDLNKYISSKHNSLRLKRELLKVLKASSPVKEKEYVDSLDTVRNRVIHSGYIPTSKEATTAYRIAKETLYNLLPH